MTEIVIIEDERLSAERLQRLVGEFSDELRIVSVLDSVDSARSWLRDQSVPDLVLLDIQLSDGSGFDLLTSGDIKCPVIFTTAYDQYAIKAFKFDGVDYLLKPVDQKELEQALEKFERNREKRGSQQDKESVEKLNKIISGDFKKRFLVKLGDRMQSVNVEDVSYFLYENDLTHLVSNDASRWPIDHSLDQLEDLINPLDFFRVNRKLIVSLPSIKEIHSYFNSRLLLDLAPKLDQDVIVSRDRVSKFKHWMDI
ncbi:MAG: response regulator transcription factor [Cyclobacteriaceae bacterium]